MNEYVGELLATREFNDDHKRIKVCKIASMWTERERPLKWNERMFVCHDFAHPQYTINVMPQSESFRQLPLS